MTKLQALLDATFVFTKRPYPVPSDLRVHWRVALLVQILRHGSRGTRSSFRRLHVMDWALRTSGGMLEFERTLQTGVTPGRLLFRYDPTLARAMNFSVAEKMVTRVSAESFALTELGVALATETERAGLMERERVFLMKIRRDATEKRIAELLRAG